MNEEYDIKPNYENDFNYPSLNRKDLMSLDTIKEKDFKKKGINRLISNRDWSMGLYNLDIDKSFPKRRDLYLNKIDFINKLDDIEKARPSKEKIYNKPNFSLNVRDIEKAYPKKDRRFISNNRYNNNVNKINLNLNNKRYESNSYKEVNKNEINDNTNSNINNSEIHYSRNIFNNNNEFIKKYYNRYKVNNNKRNNLSSISSISQNIIKPLDTLHMLQSQKNYKDTIHDVFNNYPKFINDNENKDNYFLNHDHDLFVGTPNKNKRLDIMMNKSNKYLCYDIKEKMDFVDNKRNFKGIMDQNNSVKISRKIPNEFKKQGLENLYKELDNYKPRTYEQNMDMFTHNY
jgi:hypothetical protein